MTKEGDYRRNAAQTVELASRAENRMDKSHLLALAEKWLDLADRAHRLTKRLGVTHRNHPLVDAKLADRLAKGLSWNNPARDELIELAEEFQRQAAELEASAFVEQRPGC